jgi:hypothetical protein
VCINPDSPFINVPRTANYDRSSATNVTSAVTYDRYSATTVPVAAYYTRSRNDTVTSATTYACYTSTSTVTTYTYDTRVVVVSSISGSVATDSTTTLVSGAGSLSPINSLKVNTTGNDITVTAYSSAGLVSALGSPVVRSISEPTRGTSVGIVKGPTAYNQGTTLDNFSAQA